MARNVICSCACEVDILGWHPADVLPGVILGWSLLRCEFCMCAHGWCFQSHCNYQGIYAKTHEKMDECTDLPANEKHGLAPYG